MSNNVEYYNAKMAGAKTAADMKSILEEAVSLSLGEPVIKNLRRLGIDRLKEIKFKMLLKNYWHRQHRVNGALQCQRAIMNTEEYTELTIIPDPMGSHTGNKHEDPYALALYNGDFKVGYISAKPEEFGGLEGGLAKWLSSRLALEQWVCYVAAKVGEGKASIGLRIELIRLTGDDTLDWPNQVEIESQPLPEVQIINVELMDSKLFDIFIHRELLGEEARAKFRKIRSFRVKYGTYQENYLEWLDTQISNLKNILEI